MAIGTEFEALPNVTDAYWNTLIAHMHSVFSGLITYAMNWTSLYHPLPNWMNNALFSYIGVDAYFSLIDSPRHINAIEAQTLWSAKVQQLLDTCSQQLGKSVIITEIGYRSTSDAGYTPYQRESSANQDDQEQAILYNAAMQDMSTDRNISGVFWWAWSTPPFATNDKPAAQALKHWFS